MSANSISREGGAEKNKAGGVPQNDKDIIVNSGAVRRCDSRGFMAIMHDHRGTPMVTMIKEGPTSSNKLKDIASPSYFNVLELEKNQGVESKVIQNMEVITRDHVANVKLPSRGKRPTIQINAKEAHLLHSNEILPYPTNPHTFIHHVDTGDRLSLRQSPQAVAEDEHIVVRGSDNGRTLC